jgi:hypothetical protein
MDHSLRNYDIEECGHFIIRPFSLQEEASGIQQIRGYVGSGVDVYLIGKIIFFLSRQEIEIFYSTTLTFHSYNSHVKNRYLNIFGETWWNDIDRENS